MVQESTGKIDVFVVSVQKLLEDKGLLLKKEKVKCIPEWMKGLLEEMKNMKIWSAPDVGVRVSGFSIAFLRRSEFGVPDPESESYGTRGFSRLRSLIDRLRLTVNVFTQLLNLIVVLLKKKRGIIIISFHDLQLYNNIKTMPKH